MNKIEKELNESVYEATAGGGAVKVAMTGEKKITSLEIKPEVVDPEDVEMLQDLVLTAINEALRKADDMMQEGLEGFNIPGLF